MHKRLTLLFYLSLGSVISLIVGSLFTFSAPENIFLLMLLVPLGIYTITSYITVIKKSQEDNELKEKILRKTRGAVVYFSLGLFTITISFFTTKQILFPVESTAYILATKEISKLKDTVKTMEENEKKNKQIAEELQTLTKELTDLRSGLADKPITDKDTLSLIDYALVLGTSAASLTTPPIPTKQPPTYVAIKSPQWQRLDVFETKYSSKVVGHIDYAKTYPILKTEEQHYLISLDPTGNSSTLQGWINAEFVNAY
jgi:hypothetical protein